MSPQGSVVGSLAISSDNAFLLKHECLEKHSLVRKTVEILLKTSQASSGTFGKEAASAYREIIDLTSKDPLQLEVEVWHLLGCPLLPYLPPPLIDFIEHIISEIYKIETRLKSNELLYVTTTIYKILTRHLCHLDYLMDSELYQKLKELIDKQSAHTHQPLFHRMVHEILEKLIDSNYKAHCLLWRQLPPFSELEFQEWEELVWSCCMKVKNMPYTATLCHNWIKQLVTEIHITRPEAIDKEIAGIILSVQKKHAFIANMSRQEFVEELELVKLSLLEWQQNSSFSRFFERNIKETLRYSKNLDSILNQMQMAFQYARALPLLSPTELKNALEQMRGGEIITEPSLNHFIDDSLRYIFATHHALSDQALFKEVLKLYQEALSVRSLGAWDLELQIYASLLEYLQKHPLHNTVRPISLGVMI